MVEEDDFWLEVPRNQHTKEYVMWFRTLHSRNDDYFAWIINENGTISSKNNKDLVLGYGLSKIEEHWKDYTNHNDWKKYKTIEGFEKETNVEEKEESLGPCLRMVEDHAKWMEIPYGEKKENNNLWFRSHHGGKPHFNYEFNEDGTISPEGCGKLVFGLGEATYHRWEGSFANHIGWKKSRKEVEKKRKEEAERLKVVVKEEVAKQFA
jgi:hypothetical protein